MDRLTKQILKDFIVSNWSDNGVTSSHVKQASIVGTSMDLIANTMPIYAFGLPLAGSFLLYGAMNPTAKKDYVRKIQRKALEREIQRHSPAPFNTSIKKEKEKEKEKEEGYNYGI